MSGLCGDRTARSRRSHQSNVPGDDPVDIDKFYELASEPRGRGLQNAARGIIVCKRYPERCGQNVFRSGHSAARRRVIGVETAFVLGEYRSIRGIQGESVIPARRARSDVHQRIEPVLRRRRGVIVFGGKYPLRSTVEVTYSDDEVRGGYPLIRRLRRNCTSDGAFDLARYRQIVYAVAGIGVPFDVDLADVFRILGILIAAAGDVSSRGRLQRDIRIQRIYDQLGFAAYPETVPEVHPVYPYLSRHIAVYRRRGITVRPGAGSVICVFFVFVIQFDGVCAVAVRIGSAPRGIPAYRGADIALLRRRTAVGIELDIYRARSSHKELDVIHVLGALESIRIEFEYIVSQRLESRANHRAYRNEGHRGSGYRTRYRLSRGAFRSRAVTHGTRKLVTESAERREVVVRERRAVGLKPQYIGCYGRESRLDVCRICFV